LRYACHCAGDEHGDELRRVVFDFDGISACGLPATRHGVGLLFQIMRDALPRDFDRIKVLQCVSSQSG
jgi:hypothetical protein